MRVCFPRLTCTELPSPPLRSYAYRGLKCLKGMEGFYIRNCTHGFADYLQAPGTIKATWPDAWNPWEHEPDCKSLGGKQRGDPRDVRGKLLAA